MIKNNLPNLLRNKGITRSQLAEQSGISYNTISKVYHQNIFPNERSIVAICNVLDCDLGQLFYIEKNSNWFKSQLKEGLLNE